MSGTIIGPRYLRLVNDQREWTMQDIATELGMGVQTVRGWFRNSLKGQQVPTEGDPRQLVRNWLRRAGVDPELIAGLAASPAHPEALPAPRKVAKMVPRWHAGQVRQWAMQTGRMTLDGKPMIHRSRPGRRAEQAPRVLIVIPDPRLLQDDTRWDMPRIAKELGVSKETVKTWRYKQLCAERDGDTVPHPLRFPKPIPDTGLTSKPLWLAGQVREWAMQTGRLTFDGRPRRPKSPGRPRRAAAAPLLAA